MYKNIKATFLYLLPLNSKIYLCKWISVSELLPVNGTFISPPSAFSVSQQHIQPQSRWSHSGPGAPHPACSSPMMVCELLLLLQPSGLSAPHPHQGLHLTPKRWQVGQAPSSLWMERPVLALGLWDGHRDTGGDPTVGPSIHPRDHGPRGPRIHAPLVKTVPAASADMWPSKRVGDTLERTASHPTAHQPHPVSSRWRRWWSNHTWLLFWPLRKQSCSFQRRSFDWDSAGGGMNNIWEKRIFCISKMF